MICHQTHGSYRGLAAGDHLQQRHQRLRKGLGLAGGFGPAGGGGGAADGGRHQLQRGAPVGESGEHFIFIFYFFGEGKSPSASSAVVLVPSGLEDGLIEFGSCVSGLALELTRGCWAGSVSSVRVWSLGSLFLKP